MSIRLLTLETTGHSGSVAALEDGRLLAESPLAPDQRTAQSLAPGIRTMLGRVGWRPSEVSVVAVTAGPGSFTGLRVGVTTAKAFAYATGCDILGVNTLDVLAEQAPTDVERLSAVMDAQRKELYTATFERADEGGFRTVKPTRIVDTDAWLASLTAGTAVTGPVLKKLADRLPDGVSPVPPERWTPQAAAVGALAHRQFAGGRRDDVWKLVPLYLRRSAAEEKWQRTHGPQD